MTGAADWERANELDSNEQSVRRALAWAGIPAESLPVQRVAARLYETGSADDDEIIRMYREEQAP